MIKILNKVSIEGTYLHVIQAIYDRPIANILLNETLKVSFNIKLKDVCTHHFFSTLLEVLAREIM